MAETKDAPLSREDVLANLREFVLENVVKDSEADIDGRTPLLELGILNSLSTAELIAHVRAEFGVFVPPERIFGSNFKNLEAVTSLVLALREEHSEAV
ncbi:MULTISPECIES: acyl carrier protein [unclassified Actinopolyspora]|uniref:phosphopantetheine-binding protein n=1 Tax=unclassified Actinopolyspora TaxID=2639451 RepID=UPI0013F5CD70|nr:acyl carrier protein [Actinopolyspora sp. BKK2]NHE74813.1 acyl carrier protein [Actinopolyspora sp. BKK1]